MPAVFDSDRDSVRDIIRSAMSAPLLDAEVEMDYARRWQEQQDTDALDKLVEAHMRMAVSHAIKLRGYGLPLGDLIQEGVIGLLEAAKRFDLDRGVRFCTYAGWWIRASQQDFVLRNWSIVRIGSKSAHKKIFFNVGRIRAMIEGADNGHKRQEMTKAARQFCVSESDIEVMTSRLSGKDASLNMTINEEGYAEHQDMLQDERDLPDQTAEMVIDGEKTSIWLDSALAKLSQREQRIINERFLKSEKVTLCSLGSMLGVSKERVRQIEKQAMVKLRHSIANYRDEAFRGQNIAI